jgi:hypothetical protein
MDPAEIFLWFAIAVLVIYILYEVFKRFAGGAKRYTRAVQGEILEIDLRLPYKRFKELYPWSQITYMEYKKLQMARAFKKAESSETNKRMVR